MLRAKRGTEMTDWSLLEIFLVEEVFPQRGQRTLILDLDIWKFIVYLVLRLSALVRCITSNEVRILHRCHNFFEFFAAKATHSHHEHHQLEQFRWKLSFLAKLEQNKSRRSCRWMRCKHPDEFPRSGAKGQLSWSSWKMALVARSGRPQRRAHTAR